MKFMLYLFICLFGVSIQATDLTPAPNGAKVYIISPKDGSVVSSNFLVRFGLSGMGVAPAGVMNPNTGHHHLLIDYKGLPRLNFPMPATDQLLHFGKGQTETMLKLSPGEHTLQLILGDFAHRPHRPAVISKKIRILVKD